MYVPEDIPEYRNLYQRIPNPYFGTVLRIPYVLYTFWIRSEQVKIRIFIRFDDLDNIYNQM